MAKLNDTLRTIDNIFNPRSIAVVGASDKEASHGHQYLRFLVDSGYRGEIYPVNPQKREILGLPVYPSLKEIPGEVDYVICCISAEHVLNLLKECAHKNVQAVHLYTAKFSETGDERARHLEEEIKGEAERLGVRLLGPNCMGVYHPQKRIIYNHDLSLEPGSIGGIVQSGGLAGEIVRHCTLRGVRFSKVVSYGNAADLNEIDFLEYLMQDEETKAIVMYIEGTRDGRALFETLRRAAKIKPVIVLKGGRSRAGGKTVASHTASMAGSTDTWKVLFRQTGVVQAESLNELIDLLTAFYYLPPIYGKRIGAIGGGGGKSVITSDEFEEAGLDLVPMPADIVQYLESVDPALAGWLSNPADFSILHSMNVKSADMLRRMAASPGFDLICLNASEDSLFPGDLWIELLQEEIEGGIAVKREGLTPLIVVLSNPELGSREASNWRWQTLFRLRERLMEEGIPVFSGPARAAVAINKLITYYTYQNRIRRAE